MVKKLILCCVFLITIGVFYLWQCGPNGISDQFFDNQVLTSTEIAQKAGYAAENHDIITQDNYVLHVDRITGSKKSPPSDNKTAVLLLHGILDASPTWLVAGPEVGLGYILADQGYDVWLGNVRGNRFSRKHLNLTTSDAEFWMFSWHEIGVYDLPAMIDHITEQTNQEKIFMITHSQGGAAFFVMASERPEYQEKVIALSALAPAVFMSRTGTSLFRTMCLVADDNLILNLLGIYQFMPSGTLLRTIAKTACSEQSFLLPVCKVVCNLAFGKDRNLNTTLLPLIAQYNPAGASIRQFAHFGQSILSGKFRKFDYDVAGNKENYGQEQPPDYNLGNVSVPVALYYGTDDVVSSALDVQELYEKLPSGQKSLIQSDTYAHLDFLWGNNVNTLLYNNILKFMEQHRNRKVYRSSSNFTKRETELKWLRGYKMQWTRVPKFFLCSVK